MIWNQCCNQNIVYTGPIYYGWMKGDKLNTCWIEGPQLPPSLLIEKKKRKRKKHIKYKSMRKIQKILGLKDQCKRD